MDSGKDYLSKLLVGISEELMKKLFRSNNEVCERNEVQNFFRELMLYLDLLPEGLPVYQGVSEGFSIR